MPSQELLSDGFVIGCIILFLILGILSAIVLGRDVGNAIFNILEEERRSLEDPVLNRKERKGES